jgi:hypothetical protein
LNRGNKVFFFIQCLFASADPLRLGVFASPPRRIFLLAKAQSRKEIVVRTV